MSTKITNKNIPGNWDQQKTDCCYMQCKKLSQNYSKKYQKLNI